MPLNQFVVSMDAYPYAKNQHRNSFQSCHTTDYIENYLRFAQVCLTKPYEWTESNRFIHRCLTIYCIQHTTLYTAYFGKK